MKHRWVITVVAVIVLLTLVNHTWWTPMLSYPLYPGIAASRLVLRGRMETLTLDKIGFAVEIATNLTAYMLACLLAAVALSDQ